MIGAAIEVHKELGPGLLETVYHHCMKFELSLRKIKYQSELIVPVFFKGHQLDAHLRCDLFVENLLAVELKAVEIMPPVFDAQLLTYMRLLEAPKGVLINFASTNLFKYGQKTFVNHHYRNLPDGK